MLGLFRKHATSWLIKVAFFLIVIVFVFWGGYSYKMKEENKVAVVDDTYISVGEYDRAYSNLLDMYRRQLGGAVSEEMMKAMNLKKQALDMLVERYVLRKAAQQMGFEASEQEIQQRIMEFPVFVQEGKFDQRRYVALLQQSRLTPEMFEHQVSDEISIQKVESFVKRRASVTDQEIRGDFDFTFGRVRLAYALFDPKSYESQVKVDSDGVMAYYQNHQDDYKEPEKRKLGYVLLKFADLGQSVAVTDAQVQRDYEDNLEKYHQEAEVKARHILFELKEDAPEADVAKVKAEAEKVLAEARKGGDFGQLATKYSKDSGSAKQGGELGWFGKEKMVPQFSEAAFALKPGEISDLVRTQFGFHIIKVEDVRPEKTKSLEEVKSEIVGALKEEKGREIALDKARALGDMAFAQRDLEKAAKAQNLTVTVPEGSGFAQTDKLPGLEAAPPSVMGNLFKLQDKEVSDVIDLGFGYAVFQVLAVQPPQPKPFETVKDEVEKGYKAEQMRTLAQAKATELLEAAKKSGGLEEAAKAAGVEIKQTGSFSRRQPDKDLKFKGDGLSTVLQLQPERPFPDSPVQELSNRYVVCQLLAREAPDADFEKERPTIAKRILQQKENNLWQAWLAGEKDRAKVRIIKTL
ncbi:MAG: SurA N-terminal domain-containing protein [Syntrophobacteraceae bacterium]